jgi:Uma2 family endonuclease
MTAPVKVRVSEEEYLATMTDEKPSLEFVNGEVFQKPMTRKNDNEVAHVLFDLLRAYQKRSGGYTTWEATTNFSRASDRRYRVPDMAFWAVGRPLAQEDKIYLPPTIAFEIRSDNQSMTTLREKCREYLSRGVEVCWLIDPQNRTVEVFEDERDGVELAADGVLETEQVPGLRIAVADLWSEL